MSRLKKVCITGAISSCICRLNKQKVLRREENVQRPPPVFVEACKVLVLVNSKPCFLRSMSHQHLPKPQRRERRWMRVPRPLQLCIEQIQRQALILYNGSCTATEERRWRSAWQRRPKILSNRRSVQLLSCYCRPIPTHRLATPRQLREKGSSFFVVA